VLPVLNRLAVSAPVGAYLLIAAGSFVAAANWVFVYAPVIGSGIRIVLLIGKGAREWR
jgi:hypothetical protein